VRSDAWMEGIDERLLAQLRFLLEIDQLKSVIRANRIEDGSRRENVAEHSWHLALFAAVLSEWATDEVQPSRVMLMLLLHDIVEIDAGDTPVFATGAAHDQAEREQAAADRIFALLPGDQAVAFRRLWDEFEEGATPDARFAKALDRLQPILLNHAVGGGTWIDYEVDEDRERAMTRPIAVGSTDLWGVAERIFADAVAHGWLLPAAG
jgi:5'-deoxynucleotidase YfbR-like HD superfamily hydrolase